MGVGRNGQSLKGRWKKLEMNELTLEQIPSVLQQLVCSVCGHVLKKIEWNHVESCPHRCRNSHPVTVQEYVQSNTLLDEAEVDPYHWW